MTTKISPFAMSCLDKTLNNFYDSTNRLIDVSTPELKKIAAEARSMLGSIMFDSSLRDMSYWMLIEIATAYFGEDFTEKFEEEK